MQAPIEVSPREEGEVFLLDTLSHRMSANCDGTTVDPHAAMCDPLVRVAVTFSRSQVFGLGRHASIESRLRASARNRDTRCSHLGSSL